MHDDGVSASFQFTVSDGTYTSGNNTFSVNGSPINDAPVVTAPAASLSATEQTDLEIAGTGFSVSDADDAGGGAIATLSVGEGSITVASGTSGVLVTGGNGTGSVTLSGTIDQIDNLLTGAGTITYYNGSDNPGASTVFSVTVNDQGNTGTDPGLSGDAFSEEGSNSVTINITAENDAPSIGGVDTGSVTEDVDPDLDGLLETGGILTVTDDDSGEAAFNRRHHRRYLWLHHHQCRRYLVLCRRQHPGRDPVACRGGDPDRHDHGEHGGRHDP